MAGAFWEVKQRTSYWPHPQGEMNGSLSGLADWHKCHGDVCFKDGLVMYSVGKIPQNVAMVVQIY